MRTHLHPLQIVVFQGSPSSLPQIAERALTRGPSTRFLCLLEPGQSSAEIRRVWEFAIQPQFEHAHLFINHETRAEQWDAIADFVSELEQQSQADLDVLYLSDEEGFFKSREISRGLKSLQSRLEVQAPRSIVRRV